MTPTPRPWTDAELAFARINARDGVTAKRIGAMLGRTERATMKALYTSGFRAQHARGRLVLRANRLRNMGKTYRDSAEDMGVSRQTAWNWCNGAHLPIQPTGASR